jgi:Ca-activated chloride channel homolog
MRTTTLAIFLATIVTLGGCSNSTAPEPKGEAQKVSEGAAHQTEVPLQVPVPSAAPPEGPIRAEKEMRGREALSPSPSLKKMDGMAANAGSGHPLMAERKQAPAAGMMSAPTSDASYLQPLRMNTESYTPVSENGFITTANDPLSTFSIDVDTASYSNIRRFVTSGTLPPVDAVRIEEMVNYFSYTYPEPASGPFSLTTEVGPSPWHPEYKLVRIGLKAKNIAKKDLPPSNLVFLIDVSGSMNQPNKLPLLKKSMKMLVEQLDKNDRVSMVVYAGADHIALQPTTGDRKNEIDQAIDALSAGGSTHASHGILTAYDLAERTRMPKGNNRVILASDGDFNVGVTSRGELTRLIEEKSKSGIYLTVLGFGMGNYHDDTMEVLADKGNGNYAYIDSLLEAKKVLVKEMTGTMFALAKDVKIQVEFNPAKVGAYRLIGYENRALADEDFNNDTKDAGEIGVGHTVTAMYETIPVGNTAIPGVDPLKYQKVKHDSDRGSDELLTVKVRYKPLEKETSTLLEQAVKDHTVKLESTSDDFRFAAAVVGYGMVLKDSKHLNKYGIPDILKLAGNARGQDAEGYRAEFIKLVEMSELLKK